MNILLTSGARRIDFVGFFQDALKEANVEGKVIVADPEKNAPSLQIADYACVIPHQTDEKYIDAIYNICKEHQVECLVPLNDWEVPKLAANKRQLEELGVSVFTPDPEVVSKVRDKGMYHRMLGSFGVKAPRSYFSVEEAEEALNNKEVTFPLIVKPRNGSASMGVELVDNVEDMTLAYRHAVRTIEETPLDDATSKEPEDNVAIQEVVEGDKFSVDVFNDLEGNLITTLALKQREMRGGDVDKALSIHGGVLNNIGEKIGKNLRHVGYINTEVLYDGNGYYVIDINPRFGGSYALSHAAGANIPAAYLALAQGKEIQKEWIEIEPDIELARHDTVVKINEDKLHHVLTEKTSQK